MRHIYQSQPQSITILQNTHVILIILIPLIPLIPREYYAFLISALFFTQVMH